MPQTTPDCDATDTFWSPAATGWVVAVTRMGADPKAGAAAAGDGPGVALVYSLKAVVFGDIENIVGGATTTPEGGP